MAWTGFGGGKGSINSGNQNMASGNPSAANYGGGGNSGGNQSGGNTGGNTGGLSRSAPASTAAAAAKAAPGNIGDTGKKDSGIMGGLMGAVQSARSSKASSPSGVQGAVQGAFASSESSAPEAATAGRRMSEAAARGFDNTANAGMTESAFGVGGSVGSLAGKAVGAVTAGNPYGKDSPESVAYSAGAREAKDAGLSSTTKGLASLAAGVLGGPIGSALASLALGGISYGMQQEARESALPGIGKAAPNPGNPTTNGSVGNTQLGNGNGGKPGSMSDAMAAASSTPVEDPFEFASDYSKERDPTKLNLGSII